MSSNQSRSTENKSERKKFPLGKAVAFSLLFIIPIVLLYIFSPTRNIQEAVFPEVFFPNISERVLDDGSTVKDTNYHKIPPFEFLSQLNDTFSSEDLDGYIHIADFFFTSCPGICPIMTKQMDRVQNIFLKNKRVRIVSYSVDPKRDSIEALKAYAKENQVIPGKWYLLTGPQDSIYKLARKGYFVTASEGDNAEDFVHSDKFILVDAQKRIRGYYSGTDSIEVNKLLRDVVLLLEEANID